MPGNEPRNPDVSVRCETAFDGSHPPSRSDRQRHAPRAPAAFLLLAAGFHRSDSDPESIRSGRGIGWKCIHTPLREVMLMFPWNRWLKLRSKTAKRKVTTRRVRCPLGLVQLLEDRSVPAAVVLTD